MGQLLAGVAVSCDPLEPSSRFLERHLPWPLSPSLTLLFRSPPDPRGVGVGSRGDGLILVLHMPLAYASCPHLLLLLWNSGGFWGWGDGGSYVTEQQH